MRAFIISKPKSGTYLCANLLKEFGLLHLGLHFTPNSGYYKYDLNRSDAMHQDVFKSYFKRGTTFVKNINIIPDNGLGVGHIPFKESLVKPLSKFKLIYLHRDDKGISESYARMRNDYKREGFLNKRNKRKNNSIAMWEPHCFSMSFDDLVYKNTIKIDELQKYLFNEIKINSGDAINRALSSPSITKSNKRSRE